MQQIRENPNIPKSSIYIHIDLYSNFHFSATKNSIFSIKIQRKNNTFRRVYIYIFLLLGIRILIALIIGRKYFNFNLKYSFYLFHQGRHRQFSSCGESVDGRIANLRSLHQSLDGPKIPKKFYFCSFRSILKLVFLSHYKFEFLHQELNLKHNTCTKVLS